MIKFHCRNKTNKIYEETKLTIRLKDGGKKDYSYTSDIRIIPFYFDFENHGYPLSATKNHPERLLTNDKINHTKDVMLDLYQNNVDNDLSNKDFCLLVKKTLYEFEESKKKYHSNFVEEFEKSIENLFTTEERREGLRSIARSIRRFQNYETLTSPKPIIYRYCDVNADVLSRYRIYLSEEHLLYEKHAELYKTLTNKKIKFRTKNRIITILKKIKTFSNKYRKLHKIEFDPFWGFEIGNEKYSAPIVLTEEEYEYIQNNIVEDPELQIIQKMFILQSFFGMRFVDFSNAKKGDLIEGCLIAFPKKTIKLNRKVEIPLNDFGYELIGDLSVDTADTTYLVPRFSLDQYNHKLKELFKVLGLNRIICVYDETKKEMAHKPLYELVSSHWARRTFINTLINEGYDSIAIKNMAGMSENSREIARYYAINKQYRQECANSLDKRKTSSNTPIYVIKPYQQADRIYQASNVV